MPVHPADRRAWSPTRRSRTRRPRGDARRSNARGRAPPIARDHAAGARRAPPRARAQGPSRSSASPASARGTACTSTRRAATSSSAPTGPTPARTARPTCSTSAASRRATTRRCRGCISSRGWAAWIENDGHGVRLDLRDEVILSVRAASRPAEGPPLHPPDAGRPAAGFLELTGVPQLLPEWAYGFWKSRDIYNHQTEAEADHRASATTTSRSTRSCSTPRGRRNTTRGSSTRTSSPTPPGTVTRFARTACAPSSGSRRG